MTDDRLEVLKKIEAGEISTEEALQLLDAMTEAQPVKETPAQGAEGALPAGLREQSRWWVFPTAAGAVIMALGAPLMALGLTGRVAIFWAFCCGWMPFLIGLAVLTVGAWSRNARWLHLRIENARSGTRSFALSLPLPLTPAVWVLRLLRPFVPQLGETAVDELILAAREAWSGGDDQPLVVEVQADDGGERVTVYIG